MDKFNIDFSDMLFKQVGERQLEDGDWEYTFETDKWVDDLLKKKYGKDDYSEDLSRDFNEFLKEVIEDKELAEKIKKEYEDAKSNAR